MDLQTVRDFLSTIPTFVWWIAGAIVTAIVTLTVLRAASRALRHAWRTAQRRPTLEDALTIAVASIATGVSATGMWRFAGDKLGMDGPIRVLLFAFIELAVMVSAVRARRSMRENFSAGIDGVAVWALACLTAVLSTMDARNVAEAIFRLSAPLVAAWLWERGMSIERRRLTGKKRINWRITPERILVRLGLAESSDRTASDVDAHRRLTRVAKAAKRARMLEQSGARKGKLTRALARLDRAVERAVEHAALASDEARMRQMLDQIGAVFSAGDLRTLPAVAPWAALDHPLTTSAGTGTRPGTPDPADDATDEPEVPGVPAEQPAPSLPNGPVPDPLYPVAASRYADELSEGKVPGVKRLKDDLRVGQPRADRIQSYLEELVRIWPPVVRHDAPQVPSATFREPVNGHHTPLADDLDLTEVS